jgi:elongation factor Ts
MLELIKKIRNQTGAGMVDIKKALEEAKGNEEEALKILRKRGIEKAAKKADREAGEGTIGVYVHTDGKKVALVKLLCETDFVADNEEFQQLAKDLAMQVAAMDPVAVSPEEVPEKLIVEQKTTWKEEVEKEGKPAEIAEKILSGKEQKLRNEMSLLGQAFVKDPELTVEELIKEKIAKVGENIKVGEFIRMEL